MRPAAQVMTRTFGMPPVQIFDGRPLYEHPRFPGAYRPAIYQNPGPNQLMNAFLARAPVPVRPAGQVVATSAGVDLVSGLVGLAISFGVVYAGAYYGAKHAMKRG